MKRTFYMIVLALISLGAFSQTHEVYPEYGQAWGGGSVVDVDNDGDMDLYITGRKNPAGEETRWNQMLFYNDATGEYDSVGTDLEVIERANLDWADIDGDGYVDVLGTEHSFDTYHGGVYKNNGDGTFTLLDWPIPDRTHAAAFADFNNDGWMDYVCISNAADNSCVMINNGDNTFEKTNVDVFDGLFFGLGYVEVIDYNNDGFMDFFMCANVDNEDKSAADNARVIADVFINYNEEPGNFYRAYLGITENNPSGSIRMKANGGVDFADFNSDGWIDLALNGEGGAGTGEPAAGEDEWKCVTHIYLNAKDGTFTDKAQTAFQPDLRPLGSSGVGTGVIDWNIDGHYDLVMTGWNPPTVNTQAGYLYHGDGAGNFSEVGRVPGASETVLLFSDWNGDGLYDYLVSGHSWDAMWYADPEEVGRTAAVYFNTNTATTNAPPSAPGNLAAEVTDANVELTWDAATDDLTPPAALSYEYFLQDGAGNYLIAPASFVGGDNDGQRKIMKMGNACLNTFLKLRSLDPGDYTWGVQAIDASYAGSAFATGTFKISGVSVEDVRIPALADIYAYDEMLVVRSKKYDRASVEVYNLVGQKVVSENVDAYFTRTLPQGVYVVKVSVDNHVQLGKVMIH
ncbi:MAG TPA: T9SS type A sorting domain-containing protein [Bacteroides sp.]|nr:T9SS type A sorting domain-containing protein [Bacteroides sp.]